MQKLTEPIRLINPPDFRVMTVSGNEEIKNLIELTLKHAGYQIKICKTYPEVVSILEEWIPDVLILDNELENMEARVFFENFYKIPDCRSARTIYFSPIAGTAPSWVFNPNNIGKICGITSKPFNPLEILSFLRRIFLSHFNSISLTKRRSSGIQHSKSSDDSFDTGDFRILIASGDEETRSLLQDKLEMAGYETDLCKNYAEAEEILKRWPPDVLILDDSLEDTDAETFYSRYYTHPLSKNCLTVYIDTTIYQRNPDPPAPFWVYPGVASGRICSIIDMKSIGYDILSRLKQSLLESRKRS